MTKFIYEYVRVEMPQSILKFPTMEEHRQIISDYGSKGWRYVGNIRIRQTNYGESLGCDLIFEKEIEEQKMGRCVHRLLQKRDSSESLF